LKEQRREGKRVIWRFANAKEAAEDHFHMSSRSAYGIVSRRRHRGELSRKDLQIRWDQEMEHFRHHAQPIEEWMKPIPKPPSEELLSPTEKSKPQLHEAVQRKLCDENQTSHEKRINVMVQIGSYPELWTLNERDSGRQLWEMLDKLLWGAREEEQPMWIEEPAQTTSNGWYVIFNGKRWAGEDLVEMGRYEIRFRIRGDSDVRPKCAGSPITTRSQAKKKAEEKAAAPPEPDFDVSGLLKQVQAMSGAQSKAPEPQVNPKPPPAPPPAAPQSSSPQTTEDPQPTSQQKPQSQPPLISQAPPNAQQPEQVKPNAAPSQVAPDAPPVPSPTVPQSPPPQKTDVTSPAAHPGPQAQSKPNPQAPPEAPEPDPAGQNAAPPPTQEPPDSGYRSIQAGSWLDEPTGLDERWQTIDDILCSKRKWSTQVNTTEAEQRANRAVILAIEETMKQGNFRCTRNIRNH
jgi:hypothetical protein